MLEQTIAKKDEGLI